MSTTLQKQAKKEVLLWIEFYTTTAEMSMLTATGM